MFVSTEVTLTVANIERCLKDSVAPHMMPALEKELRVAPRDTRGHPLTGVKMWLLFYPTASWQKLALALYTCTLDGALRRINELKLLPAQGRGKPFTVSYITLTDIHMSHQLKPFVLLQIQVLLFPICCH